MEIGQLLEKAREHLPKEKLALVEEAYQFALKAHQGQIRKSGEYLQHPLETASILIALGLDASSVAAALLHDVPEDCAVSIAREKIRQWFKKQARSEDIEKGKEILEKKLRRLGISFSSREEVAHLFKYQTVEDFYAAIGYGEVSTTQIALRMAVQEEQPKVTEAIPAATSVPLGIKVLGTGELLTYLARCCNPLSMRTTPPRYSSPWRQRVSPSYLDYYPSSRELVE